MGRLGLKLDGFVRALFNATDRLYCYLFASRLVSEPQSGQCNCAYSIVRVRNGDPHPPQLMTASGNESYLRL